MEAALPTGLNRGSERRAERSAPLNNQRTLRNAHGRIQPDTHKLTQGSPATTRPGKRHRSTHGNPAIIPPSKRQKLLTNAEDTGNNLVPLSRRSREAKWRVAMLEEVCKTNDIFIKLQNMIKLYQKPDGSPSFADREGLTLAGRVKLVEGLSSEVAYFELLKRCHLVEIYRQISGLRPVAYEPTEKPRRGNPRFTEESKHIGVLLQQLHPGLHPSQQAYNSQLRKVKRLKEDGRRLYILTSSYGHGVLALIPLTSWANDDEFKGQLKLLETQGRQLKIANLAIHELVTHLFKEDRQTLGRFGLEDWEPKEILKQPC